MRHEIFESRNKTAELLLSFATDQSARVFVAEEIFHALLTHPALQTQEFKALLIIWSHAAEDFESEHEKYMNNERFFYPSGYESLYKDAQRRMMEYCQRQDIFEQYIKDYRKNRVALLGSASEVLCLKPASVKSEDKDNKGFS